MLHAARASRCALRFALRFGVYNFFELRFLPFLQMV
jgi:hypothetical protein